MSTLSDRYLREIPVADLRPSPYNPRRMADDDEVVDLAESLAEHGLLQPLVVRSQSQSPLERGNGAPEGQEHATFEIVCGHRRALAAARAGLATVACRVVKMTDAQAIEAALVENSQRREVPPLEEAAALGKLIDLGVNIGEIEERLGRSRRWVRDRLALRDLSGHYRALFEAGRIGLRSAVLISNLPELLQGELEDLLCEDRVPWNRNGWTHREVSNFVAGRSRRLSDAPWSLDDSTLGGHGACSGCRLRSDAQPDLWAVDDAARCLDLPCWNAHLEGYLAHKQAQGAKLRTGPRPYDGSVVAPDEQAWVVNQPGAAEGDPAEGPSLSWTELAPQAPRTIFVSEHGGPPQEVLEVADIVEDLDRRGEWNLADRVRKETQAPATKGKTADRPRIGKRELRPLMAELVRRIEAGIGEVLSWRIDDQVFIDLLRLPLLVVTVWGSLRVDEQKEVAARRGWSEYRPRTRPPIDEMSVAELHALMIEALCTRDLLGVAFGGTGLIFDNSGWWAWLARYSVPLPEWLQVVEQKTDDE